MINTGLYTKILPEKVTFTEEGLYWGKKLIGNFCPVIVCILERHCNEEVVSYANLKMHFTDGTESISLFALLSDIGEIDWFKLDVKCQLNPDLSKAKEYLVHIVRFALSTATVEKQYEIDHFGTHMIEGTPVFYTGEQIICSPSFQDRPNISLKPLSYKLDFDIGRYSESDALIGIMKVLGLSPKSGLVILSHILSGFTRSVYIDIKVKPSTVLEVIGPSGFKKTTITSFLTQVDNREGDIRPLTRLNATVSAIISLLNKYADGTVLIDDMHPADSRKIERQNEETFEVIVRSVGDNAGRGRIIGGKFDEKQPMCNVIITGEYPFGKGSTAARCLVVPFLNPIDNQKLFECQQEPLLVSTFYYYYISWYIENYFDIRDSLAEMLSDFRKINLGVHPRLAETQFCLFSAYMLFLRYCTEKGYLSHSTEQSEKQSFWKLLTHLVKEQDHRTKVNPKRANTHGKVDYFELIRMWHKEGVFNLAKDIKHLKEHDGLVHNGFLCLRAEKLLKKVQKVATTATLSDIRSSLIAKNALRVDGEGKGMQVGKKRFYGIPLKKLQ